jgi:catechol 2,3-dioxygenase-like lactoylglutathione lyase family enzyme
VEGEDFAISLEYPVGSGAHVAFATDGQEQVDAVYAAAPNAAGRDSRVPGLSPECSDEYYGAFVLDPDGNNVDAVYHR